MNFYDLLIIYMACGAPVSVYYYFQNRRLFFKQLWLKTILTFVFWIPYFVQLLIKSRIWSNFSKTDYKSKINLTVNDVQIQTLKRKIEYILSASDLKISIYEFREVFERFVGLTIARSNNNSEPFKHEKELYRISSFQNQQVSARCLHRRNQKLLYFHQTEAEKDFLEIVEAMLDSINNPLEFKDLLSELFKLLDFSGAQTTFINFSDLKLQTNRINFVIDLEKDLWKPETLKLPIAKQFSMRLQTSEKKAKSYIKD